MTALKGDDPQPQHLCGKGPAIEDFPTSEDLAGLALSGGGIRSATFALGAVQALHKRGALRLFDYLSTVSGGGFTGAWWSAWLSRPNATPFPLPEDLEPSRYPPVVMLGDRPEQTVPRASVPVPGLPVPPPAAFLDPVNHLRLFANYLTPRRGLWSADTWRGVTFYLRTLFCTWLMLLPLLLAAVMAAQWFFAGDALRFIRLGDASVSAGFLCSRPDRVAGRQTLDAEACKHINIGSHADVLGARLSYATAPLVLLSVLLLTLSMLWLLHATAHPVAAVLGAAGMTALLGYVVVTGGTGGEARALTRVAVLVASFAVALHAILVLEETAVYGRVRHDVHRIELSRWQSWTLSTMAVALMVLLVGGFGHEIVWFVAAPETGLVAKAGGWGTVLAAVGGGVFTAFKLLPSGRTKDSAEQVGRLTGIALLVVPYLVLGVLLVIMSWLGWWMAAAWTRQASLPAPSSLVLWASFFPMGFAIFEWIKDRPQPGNPRGRWDWWSWSPLDNALLTGAILALLPIVIALPPIGTWLEPIRGTPPPLPTVLGHVALGFSFGFVAPNLIDFIDRNSRPQASGRALLLAILAFVGFATIALDSVGPHTGRGVWAILVLLVLWVVGLGWMVDPNLLSMQNFYRARLIRAYLGASNPQRPAITQESAGDDVALTHLRGRPYHLVNTTLNLAGARDLAAGQRPAANFVFSRYFSGSGRTTYRWTDEYMGGGLTLGTAMGISGAAASPSMGRQTPSIALTMLMALLNVRLGSWMPNPAKRRWREGQAHLWPFYLAYEFLARSTDTESYCYLTDGGHFDNTGIYALVERGCRYIVVLDAGADPELTCADIGQAVRMCRIDFGAEIDLDVGLFRRRGRERLAERHVVVGNIVYHQAHWESLGWPAGDNASRTGRIIWIKPMVVAGDSADIRQYGRENREFPQQTTLDQWYDEAQFESYRKLGYDSVMRALATAVAVPTGAGRAGIHSFFFSVQSG